MIHEKINLKNFYPSLENDVILETYCPDNFEEWSIGEKRKGLLILPGGGYGFLSERESEPVALRFAGYNIACFVLKYTIAPKIKYPFPLVEVYAALAYIRKNCDKYYVFNDKLSVLGFSAGGHLAASASCYHTKKEFADFLNIDLEEMKINGCLLSYPVISSEFGHKGSIDNITNGDPKLLDFFSIEKRASKDFPKTFIWHTSPDTIVPLKNSLALADKLIENNVFLELHVYPTNDHGISLADRSVYKNADDKFIEEMRYNTQWVDNALHFIKEYI